MLLDFENVLNYDQYLLTSYHLRLMRVLATGIMCAFCDAASFFRDLVLEAGRRAAPRSTRSAKCMLL